MRTTRWIQTLKRSFANSKTSNTSQTDADNADPKLLEAVNLFAAQLIDTCNGVLPYEVAFKVGISGGHITINQSDALGIPIRVDGNDLLRLIVNYRCLWNTGKSYFAVSTSTFKVQPLRSGAPLFTFDYDRDATSTLPCAHINVHGHRDETVAAMMAAGKKNRAKGRAKKIEAGHAPSLSSLHFPVGGHRFRPCIEDVFEMLINEFGIDTRRGYQTALNAGRSDYRTTQLRTAIADDLEMAAALLHEKGYDVSPHKSGPAARRHERFSVY